MCCPGFEGRRPGKSRGRHKGSRQICCEQGGHSPTPYTQHPNGKRSPTNGMTCIRSACLFAKPRRVSARSGRLPFPPAGQQSRPDRARARQREPRATPMAAFFSLHRPSPTSHALRHAPNARPMHQRTDLVMVFHCRVSAAAGNSSCARPAASLFIPLACTMLSFPCMYISNNYTLLKHQPVCIAAHRSASEKSRAASSCNTFVHALSSPTPDTPQGFVPRPY